MAIVKTPKNKIRNNHAVNEAVKYISNPDKSFAVSAVNVPSGTSSEIADQFEMTRQIHNQDKGIIAHHLIQSFSPQDNITPEQAHQLGLDFINKVAPNFEIVFATHIDKGHIHNHYIINSCNVETGKKWHDNTATLRHLQDVSDDFCREYNLNIIEKRGERQGIDQTTYQLALKGKSWKMNLITDLDGAAACCKSKVDFIDYLNKKGYAVRYTAAHITVTKNGEKKGIRVDTLAKQFGEKYSKVNLEKAMGYHSFAPTIDDYPEEKNKPQPQKKQRGFQTEWQKYEEHYFNRRADGGVSSGYGAAGFNPPVLTYNLKNAGENSHRLSAADKAVSSAERGLFYTNSAGIFLLRLIFLMALKSAMRDGRFKPPMKPSKYMAVKLPKTRIQNLGVRTSGNIPYGRLKNADGDNLTVKVSAGQLAKLTDATFFYSARIDFTDRTCTVLLKAANKDKLAGLIDIPAELLSQKYDAQNNLRVYERLKRGAKAQGVKVAFRVFSASDVKKLREDGLEFACFEREGDGKFNVAFLPEQTDRVYKALRSSPPPRAEAVAGRDVKVNSGTNAVK